jgi:hypothetical protein
LRATLTLSVVFAQQGKNDRQQKGKNYTGAGESTAQSAFLILTGKSKRARKSVLISVDKSAI